MTNFFGAGTTASWWSMDSASIPAWIPRRGAATRSAPPTPAWSWRWVGRFAEEIGYGGPLDEFYRKIRHRHSMDMQPIVVVVDDGNGYRSMYVHLSKALVKVGDNVRRHMVLGLEGRTGNANGCHVHYELVRMDGPWMRVASQLVKEYGYPAWERERVDPLRVLDLHVKRAGKFVPGILRPKLSASLRPHHPTSS